MTNEEAIRILKDLGAHDRIYRAAAVATAIEALERELKRQAVQKSIGEARRELADLEDLLRHIDEVKK